jgi:hypothetical protein
MSVVGKTLDFIFYRGVTFQRSFTYKAAGVPVDLTGKVIEFHFRKKDSLTDHLNIDSDTAPTANDTKVVITDAENGKFTVKVADEDITAIPFELGNWWVGLNDGVDPQRIGGGTVTVLYP